MGKIDLVDSMGPLVNQTSQRGGPKFSQTTQRGVC